MSTEQTAVTVKFDHTDGTRVSNQMGNGLRTVIAREIEVSVRPDWTYITVTGPSVLRSGEVSGWKTVGFTLGRDALPEWLTEIAAVAQQAVYAMDLAVTQ